MTMKHYFHNPENGLKRANEFYNMGKPDRALDVLSDVIKSKKHRTWLKVHEPIMMKFVALCVELKKSHAAKEGLYQYKNICQQVNIKSLDMVMTEYLKLAEQKTEEARQLSLRKGAEKLDVKDVKDLDSTLEPEQMLLRAVSGEDSQDRNDRAILTPWLKFMWESYRQCLDLLRNNPLLEKLYQDVAVKALKFCQKYERKTEFRKLCENLRTHLSHIQKNQNQQRTVNLSNIDSQSLHLEIRLTQVECAIKMELWQEAFKAIEDIHNLIVLSKKQPKPSLLANYYQKMALVLLKSGNGLFHACAWHRLFHLYRDQKKNMTEKDLQELASRVLCATLAVPMTAGKYQNDHIIDEDSGLEKQKKLASLLNYSALPTRNSLIRDILKHNIIQLASPELSNLYTLLEVDFQPMELPTKVKACLEILKQNADLAPYVPMLQDVTLTKFIKQISQVFQTISFLHLHSMIPFTDKIGLQRIIIETTKNLGLQVRMSSDLNLSFGTDINMSHEDKYDGPKIQTMQSEQLRNQLVSMSNALAKSVAIICPGALKEARDNVRLQLLQSYKNASKKEHQHMLLRRQIIEEKKEEIENLNVQREREEQEQIEVQKRRQYEAEMARLTKEAEEREKQRKIDEHRDIQKKVVKERLEQIKSSTVGAKAFADLSEEALANMDMDDILAKQVEQLEKEKKEREEKLKAQEKKVDYFERAKCLEELPLLRKKFEEDKIANKLYWEESEKERINELVNERNLAIEMKDRLALVKDDQEEFIARIMAARMTEYNAKLVEYEKLVAEAKAKLLLERKAQRKEDRRAAWVRETEEKIIRKRDEEIRKKKEEEDRITQAKKEQEDLVYKEKLAKLAEIEEKKKQRELEIEERKKQKDVEDDKRKDDSSKTKERTVGRDPANDGWRARGGDDNRDGSRFKTDPPRRDDFRTPRDDVRGPRDDVRGPRDDNRGPRDDNRGPRDDFRSQRDDVRGPRDDNRGPRDDNRGPRDDNRGPRDDFRTQRDDRTRSYRDEKPRDSYKQPWNAPRNDDTRKDEGSWRRNEAPKKTESSWRSQASAKEEPVKREDSWRSQRTANPAPPARNDKKEEPKPRPPRRDDDDGWQTVRK